jgi:hypothetical protein
LQAWIERRLTWPDIINCKKIFEIKLTVNFGNLKNTLPRNAMIEVDYSSIINSRLPERRQLYKFERFYFGRGWRWLVIILPQFWLGNSTALGVIWYWLGTSVL